MKYEIKYEELEQYLKKLKDNDFQTSWRNNPDAPMKDAKLRDDMHDFSVIPSGQIIEYGMPFLVDALGNDLAVMQLSKRSYKLPNGRVVKAKFIKTIISDCRAIYGTPLNGYWVIPEQFLTIKK